jgi:GNAT superfamily N-acetyltransferase
MSIEIKQTKSTGGLRKFVSFANQLYHGHPCYVPVIVEDEIKTLSERHNPAVKNCETAFWIAYRDKKPVGRIAGIINTNFIDKWGKRFARFGWMDFIDDPEVARALIETVEKWALSRGMEAMNGPLGFTDFDPEGLLVEGFDEKATIIERYNHHYYGEFLENMGYTKDADWVEFEVKVPASLPENIKKVANHVSKRYGFKVIKINKIEDVMPYVGQIFDTINNIYGLMYGFVPLSASTSQFYISKYVRFLDPSLIALITDKDDKLIAFGVAMPSFSDVFQKANGNRFRLKWLMMRGEHRKTDTVDMYFIGVKPDYINKGISSVLLNEVGQRIIDQGYQKAETNIEYESNEAVQSLWKHFDSRQHKRRRCYLKYFLQSTRMEDNI